MLGARVDAGYPVFTLGSQQLCRCHGFARNSSESTQRMKHLRDGGQSLLERGDRLPEPSLLKSISRTQYLALGFGTILGSGWVVLLGSWLRDAGPGGAIIGFLLGGGSMTAVALVFAELTARFPIAGGDFTYAYNVLGHRCGFIVGWFLILFLISVCGFEAISLPWILQTIYPGFGGQVAYSILSTDVTVGALVIGVVGVLLIALLNYREIKLAVRVHTLITFALVVTLFVVLIGSLSTGSMQNVRPIFASSNGRSWLLGAGWVFATSAFSLNGFQAIPQTIEERAPGVGMNGIAKAMAA